MQAPAAEPASEKEIVSLDKLKPVPKPDENELKEKIEDVNGKISALQTRLASIKDVLDSREQSRGDSHEVAVAKKRLNDSKSETRRLSQEKRNIQRDRELLALSRNNYTLQKNDLDRLLKLGEDSLVSKSRLDETRIKLIQLESEVARLKSSVATAESRIALKQAARNRAARNLERTQLPAPFAGTVNAVNAQVGDYVTPSQVMVDLIDAASLDLYAEVRGSVAQSLKQGQAITVEVDGMALQGTLIALQMDPSPDTFTHALRVRIDGDSARPGQVARVRLPLQQRRRVTAVPSTAVLFDEGRAFVFRLDGDSLQQVPVITGERVDGLQVVLQGLDENDRVVSRDVSALSNGQRVQVLEPDAR